MEHKPPSAAPMPDEWYRREFDHLSPELAPVLTQTLSRMRAGCPIAHSEKHNGFWVLTKYEDVLEVAQDWETFTSTKGLNIPAAEFPVRNIPVQVDPPEQRAYKRFINAYFTPKQIAHWEAPSRALVTRLIDGFIERGECDFMDDFARPFPSRIFFQAALDAPAEDLDRVSYMASKASIPNDPDGPECVAGLAEWVGAFIEGRRGRQPRGDIVDAVLTAEFEGRPLTRQEMVGIVQLLILGGLETTAGALGLMMLRFCEHPQIPALLRAEPERIPKAVEELLRLDGPFIAIARTATRDTQVRGREIKEGDKVLIYWASANRDSDEFTAPDDFDPDRSPNRHLAFGAGPHRCLGSNVARQNLRIALEELVRRLDDLRLADGADIHFHSTVTRSPLHVPITFRPGPREAAAASGPVGR